MRGEAGALDGRRADLEASKAGLEAELAALQAALGTAQAQGTKAEDEVQALKQKVGGMGGCGLRMGGKAEVDG